MTTAITSSTIPSSTVCVGDSNLLEAAKCGDVEFLDKIYRSNMPDEYYLDAAYLSSETGDRMGNIFHVAALHMNEEFIQVATKILPLEVKQKLILQQHLTNSNPLHLAAQLGNVKIVKLFLSVFKNVSKNVNHYPPSSSTGKPWLQKDDNGSTPCHIAENESCGLEILRMDMNSLCNITDNDGRSLLCTAVVNGFTKIALEILRSHVPCEYGGPEGYTALHYVAGCSVIAEGQEITKLLLERNPSPLGQKTRSGISALHSWAADGKLWPFECLKDRCIISEETREVVVDLLISPSSDEMGWNPLHFLAACSYKEDSIKIAELLIEVYEQASTLNIKEDSKCPWLEQDKKENTPLTLAILKKNETLANYILSKDANALKDCPINCFFFAMEERCHSVVKNILDIVDEKGWTEILTDDETGESAMHWAPYCTNEIRQRLLREHEELLKSLDNHGATVLHSWLDKGEISPFEFFFLTEDIDRKYKRQLVDLMSYTDSEGRTPFHQAAISTDAAIMQIVQLLVKAFRKEEEDWEYLQLDRLPWFKKNGDGVGPIHEALCKKNEDFALFILSQRHVHSVEDLLNYYEPEHKTVFMAIEKNNRAVVQKILNGLDRGSWTRYLMNSSNGQTVLHLAPCCEEQLGRWLVETASSEFISKEDNSSETPLEKACDVGAAWFIEAILRKQPSAYDIRPMAWIKACEKQHVSAIRALICHNSGKFRDFCIVRKDSPLHHINLNNLLAYEALFNIPCIKELINLQDGNGETPLHKAIQIKDIYLTEMLLKMENIEYDIKNQNNETAIDLLVKLYINDRAWEQMCQRIGFNPKIKMTNFKRKANLVEVRTTLSLVAALLATITFTAGFTLPGGFNQDTGKAIMGKKAVFLAFLLFDTLAMCSSVLVLLYLIWSTGCDTEKALHLIDRSMWLFKLALCCTSFAFMTGVYAVVSSKSLWAAILIIVMCSIVGLSASRHVFNLFLHVDSFLRKFKCTDLLHLMEQGNLNNEPVPGENSN